MAMSINRPIFHFFWLVTIISLAHYGISYWMALTFFGYIIGEMSNIIFVCFHVVDFGTQFIKMIFPYTVFVKKSAYQRFSSDYRGEEIQDEMCF